MTRTLNELAAIIREAETVDELLGSLRIWAGTVIQRRPPREIAYIEVLPSLNYRQQWAYRMACEQGRLVTSQVAQRFSISMEAARMDLHEMVELGKLLAISEKKGRYYLPVVAHQDDTSGHQGMAEGVPAVTPVALSTPPSAPLSEY